MAGFEVGMTPVFIRVGCGGEEYEVGSFSPTATLDGDVATVSSGSELAEFLRAVADAADAGPGSCRRCRDIKIAPPVNSAE